MSTNDNTYENDIQVSRSRYSCRSNFVQWEPHLKKSNLSSILQIPNISGNCLISGGSGNGKSEIQKSYFVECHNDVNSSIIVIDPHGDVSYEQDV